MSQINLMIFRKFEFGDKAFNIQFTRLTPEDKAAVYRFVRTEAVFEPVKAFFQGDVDDWIMLEFWAGSAQEKRSATLALMEHLGRDRIRSDDLEKLDDIGE